MPTHPDVGWRRASKIRGTKVFRMITACLCRMAFNDKHLGPVWSEAKWMYDTALAKSIPLMAGSSLPLSFRNLEITVPMNAEIEASVGVGFSGLDIYENHTIDVFQSYVGRCRGAETGVRWVQCLQADAMWKAVDDGRMRKDVLEAALDVVPRNQMWICGASNGNMWRCFYLSITMDCPVAC